jgi:hypothetical protein
MSYEIRPLALHPARLKGLSKRLIVSHENNHAGAVGRLNAIGEKVANMTRYRDMSSSMFRAPMNSPRSTLKRIAWWADTPCRARRVTTVY